MKKFIQLVLAYIVIKILFCILLTVVLVSTEAPKLDLSKLAGKEIRVRAGEQIKFDIPFSGIPTPLISWKKDGKEILSSAQVSRIMIGFN